MKTKFSIIALVALLFTVGLTSCDQIKEKIFNAFLANSADIDFTIDIISDTSKVGSIDSLSTNMDLDSIIRVQTNNAFNLTSITSINLEECKMTILNPDATNNLANFEQGNLTFSTDSKSVPVQVCSGIIADVYSDSWLMPVDKTINLKEYLIGHKLSYNISAKARRVTTKKLDCKMSIKFKVN